MTLEEAILYCAKVILSNNYRECKIESIQLIGWLAELKLRREGKWEESNAITGIHFNY